MLSLPPDEIGISAISLAHVEQLMAEAWICLAPDLNATHFDLTSI